MGPVRGTGKAGQVGSVETETETDVPDTNVEPVAQGPRSWSVTGATPTRRTVEAGPVAPRADPQARLIDEVLAMRRTHPNYLMPTQMATDYPVVRNNQVELLSGGNQVFPRLFHDLKAAKKFIHITHFQIAGREGDKLSKEMEDLLVQKAKDGVEVRLKYEPIGSGNAVGFGNETARMVKRLRAAGVKVIENNFYNSEDKRAEGTATFGAEDVPRGGKPLEHRKFYIMDAPEDAGGGTVAYTGGMGMQDKYRDEWHDTMGRVQGDGAHQAQIDFLKDWMHNGGTIDPKGKSDEELKAFLFPQSSIENGVDLQGTQNVPYVKNSTREQYIKTIDEARVFVRVENPYFTDQKISQALQRAARRGVDVQIILPRHSDFPALTMAMRGRTYGPLLAAGARVYEYLGDDPSKPPMMHAKLMATENTATFGSYNFDGMSRKNTEFNYWSTHPDFKNQVNAQFARDVARSQQVQPGDLTGMQRFLGITLSPIIGPML